MKIELQLIAAVGCLKYTEVMVKELEEEKEDSILKNLEHFEQFKDLLTSFYSFIKLAVDSEIPIITIPERYHLIYNALRTVAISEYVSGELFHKIKSANNGN